MMLVQDRDEKRKPLSKLTSSKTVGSATEFISATIAAGGSETECQTFAANAIDSISTTFAASQTTLNTLETGSQCVAEGQNMAQAPAQENAQLKQQEMIPAQVEAEGKQQAMETACSASPALDLNMNDFKNGVLDPTSVDVSKNPKFIAANEGCVSATIASTAADKVVAATRDGWVAAKAALAELVAEAPKLMRGCLCRVKNEHDAAWTAASSAIPSLEAQWKQAHEIVCALDKADTACVVPPRPTLTKPVLVTEVSNENCATATTTPAFTPNVAANVAAFTAMSPEDRAASVTAVLQMLAAKSPADRAAAVAAMPSEEQATLFATMTKEQQEAFAALMSPN